MNKKVFEMTDIATFIQNVADGDNVKASSIFDQLMAVKVNDTLEAEKIRMADVQFNGADPDEDPEIEDEDLEDEDEEDTEDEEENDDDESEEELEEGEDEEESEDEDVS